MKLIKILYIILYCVIFFLIFYIFPDFFKLIFLLSPFMIFFIIKIEGVKGDSEYYYHHDINSDDDYFKSRPSLYERLFQNEHNLFKFTYKELIKIEKNKGQYKSILESTLDSLSINSIQFNDGITFFTYYNSYNNSLYISSFFCKRIGASYTQEGLFYRIYLDDKFSLNINTFLLYYTDKDTESIKKDIINLDYKVLVFSKYKYQNEVYKLAKDKTNRIIAPSLEQFNKLILSNESETVLIEIFLSSLLLKDVSPYQLNGDIKNELNFFGRVEILREIISNDEVNYLIVGARQLGKSSILKALERRYEKIDKLDCYSFTLDESGDIVGSMSEVLGLPKDSSLDDIVASINSKTQKPIFLIDEADMFVKHEKESGYLITSVLRKLSQEGKATFVMAGFWTLYEYVVLDYHSPLKNFGKLITLDGLEQEACRELMIEPMSRIGVSYENEKMIDEVIEICGRRANYIAIICDVILQNLENHTIEKKDIGKALESDAIYRMLKSWEALSANKESNKLDRVIVYLTIEKESFRLGDVTKKLKEQGLKIDIECINESIERLLIGYVIGRGKRELFLSDSTTQTETFRG